MSAEPTIAARGVEKRFGKKEVLRGVDFEVAAGAKIGIIGPAASGKSVLLKLFCGLEQVDGGNIRVFGRDVTTMSEIELMDVRLRVGMLFQNYALFDSLSVQDNVAFPLRRLGKLGEDEIASRVAERLKLVGLAGSEDKMTGELSGGMRKRVGIARATVAQPDLVIYDEPTAGLDPVTTSKVYDLIDSDREQTGCTVVAVSSDIVALLKFADTIAMLESGRIRYIGPPDELVDADDPLVRQFVRGELQGPL